MNYLLYITLYVFIFPIWSLFSYMDRPGTCIIILDKKYNIANSSCHFGSYGSIWTGPSPKTYYMGLVHILPYDPQCHEIFAIYRCRNKLTYNKAANIQKSIPIQALESLWYIDLFIIFAEKVHLCFISICRKKKMNGFLKICCFIVSQFVSTPIYSKYFVALRVIWQYKAHNLHKSIHLFLPTNWNEA
jgi:hypothetical protein